MIGFRRFTLIACVLIITGCSTSYVTVNESFNYNKKDVFYFHIKDDSKVTKAGIKVFQAKLHKHMKKLKLSGQFPNKIIEIKFVRYHMRHGAARALLGIMAGTDSIASFVTIRNRKNRAVIGRFYVESENDKIFGSAGSLIEDHVVKILKYIRYGKT